MVAIAGMSSRPGGFSDRLIWHSELMSYNRSMEIRDCFTGLVSFVLLLGTVNQGLSADTLYQGNIPDYTYISVRKPPYRTIPARSISTVALRNRSGVSKRRTLTPELPVRPQVRKKAVKSNPVCRDSHGICLTVSYQQTPLVEIIDELRDELKINVVAFWPEMSIAGYLPETPVSLELDGVPVFAVLNAVTNYVSAGAPEPLGWTLNGGILTLNLKRSFPRRQKVHVYYVGDLVAPRSDLNSSSLFGSGSNRSGNGKRSAASTRSNRSSRSGTSGRSDRTTGGSQVDNAYQLVDTIESVLGTSNSPASTRDH